MGVAPIKMPQLGESVTEGTVDRWLKKEGDLVRKDEPLVEVTTDKVNTEIPSPFEGTLVGISVTEGTTVAVGAEIARMEVEAAPAEAAPASSEVTAAPAPARSQETDAAPTTDEPAPGSGSPARRSRFSPAVRRLVEEHGIDPSLIAGSGDGGRVTRDDVLAFLETRQAPAGEVTTPVAPTPAPASPAPDGEREELVRLSVMRRSIAEHMTRSLATSPHAWTLQEVDVSELVRYREAEKDGFRSRHGVPLTYLPFVAQVLCDALREFPYLNSSWTDDGILLKKYVNLGMA
ncbi:MAG: 2-oxo acid dehydrogenase subunit E2, partial [Candidatus Dormibacteraeota bacterium]|nr:2-oxo acid dehydrogenase subunit E2 [Candidatus Dormibacteraeota bacterium]